MVSYRKARPEERAEIVDFANYVFSQAHRPHDFKTLLPKVYADGLDPQLIAGSHYVADVDGKIRALVACPRLSLLCAGETVRVGLIGTVSVHPYTRHEGYMRSLMDFAMQDAGAQGADLLILGGQHQRYQHFGFEYAGSSYYFRITAASARHAWADVDVDGIRIQAVEPGSPLLDEIYGLYEKETISGMRSRENFLDCCRSWYCELMAVLKDGRLAGYLIASGNGEVSELVMAEEGLRDAALKLWLRMTGREFSVWAAPYQTDRIRDWMADTDSFRLENQELIRVLHWLPVLRAAMALRCAGGNARDGEAVLDVDGQRYLLSVKGGRSSVELTGRPADAAPLCGTDAVRRLFGLGVAACPGLNVLDGSWLPLPFNLPLADHF